MQVMYKIDFTYSLIQKNGETLATVYSSKCVTVFLNQTIHTQMEMAHKLVFKLKL